MRIVNVQLNQRAYPIFIGAQARNQLTVLLKKLSGIRQVAIVTDSHVAGLHLDQLTPHVEPPFVVLEFPPGEQSKTLEQAATLYDRLAECRFARSDLIVTLGGGVAGDLGGFVAATWMRGVRFVQVPTTLEAAIDASIGGKTAVNHRAGKNLIGAFHQPQAVVVDTDFLKTLPQRDYLAGLGESVKHAAIRDEGLLEWHERHVEQIIQRDSHVLEQLIARNCEIKAEVVALDEREDDLRMILNYGHTVAHGIEHLLGYELRHGECVALGILVENELAAARGLLDRAVADRIRRLIENLQLPVVLPKPLDPQRLAEVVRIDKKVRGGAVTYVMITTPGRPRRVCDISDDELRQALETIQPAPCGSET